MKPTKVSASKPELPAVRLQPRDPESLRWETQQVQLAIARRAFELFEKRGQEHGHDWEDWFQAESELLRPVPVAIFESVDRLSLRANVLGFGENELKVSIEPKRVVILGQREANSPKTEEEKTEEGKPEEGKIESIDWNPDLVSQFVELPTQVDPEGAVVELQAGLLRFELPKAAKQVNESGASAA
jgi:HSP20 family molecular chaperone IbpA